jgi:hypothetical protein
VSETVWCQAKGVSIVCLSLPPAAEAGFAGVGSLTLLGEGDPIEVVMLRRQPQRTSIGSGGGGNRTRVRNRPVQSVYKLRLPLSFARRPVGSRPTAGLAIL